MIVKQPLPEDPTPSDAPPSYDALTDVPGPSVSVQDYKGPLIDHSTPVASSSRSAPPLSPSSSTSFSLKSPTFPSADNKGKGRATNWFSFTTSAEARTAREVRNTVIGLVRDLVQEYISNSPASTGILQSCSEACSSHSLSFSSILQERSIEDHTPLYWAIVKRPPDQHTQDEDFPGPDLLTSLISYASPLTQETVTELRVACLATSDQALFQRLRQSPEFAPVSGSDQMLLGGSIPPEEVELEDMAEEGGGAFAVNIVIPQFHKRMVVSKEIAVEFIARSRMWRLAFFIAPERRHPGALKPGSWCIALSLVENSPPTSLDSRLVISEAKSAKSSDSSAAGQSLAVEASEATPTSPKSPFRLGQKTKLPTISIRLKSIQQLEAPGRRNRGKSIVVPLEESALGANLQYGNNPYIGPDEKLRVRFEARLGKSDADCIIC